MSYFIRNNLYCFTSGSFLSNFHEKSFSYKEKIWPTSEHAYQAMKSRYEEVQEWIRNSHTPGIAKKRGKQIDIRRDWDFIKLEVMEEILQYKFQDYELRQKLLDTKPYQLIEYTTWNDTYWGTNTELYGQNHLGILLTKLRNDYVTDVINL